MPFLRNLFSLRPIIVKKAIPLFLILLLSTPLSGQETGAIQKYDTTLMMVRSPRLASFYSAVLPGLGQAYNQKYWKVPVIYVGGATLVYFIKFNNDKYSFYRNLYIKKLANDPSDMPELAARYHENTLKGAMDYWGKNRDYCVIGLAVLYLANIIDATVDAYLFDYDVTQDISMKIQPSVINSGYSYSFGLICSLKF